MCAACAWPWTLQKRGTEPAPHTGGTASHGGGRERAHTPPGPREPLDGGRLRTKRAQRSGPSPRAGPRNLPRRGAIQTRTWNHSSPSGSGWQGQCSGRGSRRGPEAERAGCIQETGRREGRPEGGVRGKSECGASRLARHGVPGHEGPRVQGQTAVTLSWRQRQPHGCLCGWKGSHQGAVPGEERRVTVAEARLLLRSASGPRTAHTSWSLGPRPVICSQPLPPHAAPLSSP